MKTAAVTLFLLACSGVLIIPGTNYRMFDRGPYSEIRANDSIILPYVPDLYARNAIQLFYKRQGFHRAWFIKDSVSPAADSLILYLNRVCVFGLVQDDFRVEYLDSLSRIPYSPASADLLDILLTDAFFKLADQLNGGRLQILNHGKYGLRVVNQLSDSVLATGLGLTLNKRDFGKALRQFEPLNARYRELAAVHRAMVNEYETAFLSLEERLVRQAQMMKVAANLERWRWRKSPMPSRYLWVNIPAYRLVVYENEQPVLESKVIVGTKAHPTPQLQSAIECIIVYPYWHVPRSIATKELLPQIRKDPAYLTRNNFDLLTKSGAIADPGTIDWQAMTATNFPYTMRQREGSDNALGVLKFQFENPYAVYLHDTNVKKLFSSERRAYSHGCVRVEKAYEFAQYLIRYDSGKVSTAMLDRYLSSRTRRDVTLQRPLPIFIDYFTADQSGIYEDIYQRDGHLLTWFARMFPSVTDLPDHSLRLCDTDAGYSSNTKDWRGRSLRK